MKKNLLLLLFFYNNFQTYGNDSKDNILSHSGWVNVWLKSDPT